jgi:hypothetical protein
MASQDLRTLDITARSTGDDIEPLRPSAPTLAPSSVETIIPRTQRPASGHG